MSEQTVMGVRDRLRERAAASRPAPVSPPIPWVTTIDPIDVAPKPTRDPGPTPAPKPVKPVAPPTAFDDPIPWVFVAHEPVTAFGRVIDELCATRSISLGELCRRTGVDISTISRNRSGGRQPMRKLINRLVDGMDDLSDDERRRLYLSAGFVPEWEA